MAQITAAAPQEIMLLNQEHVAGKNYTIGNIFEGDFLSLDTDKEKYLDMFKVSLDQQNEIYENCREIIRRAKQGEEGLVFDSLVDIERSRQYNEYQNSKVFVIDVGGSFLKIGTVEIKSTVSEENSIVYNTTQDLKEYPYEPLEDEKPLKEQNWYDWVASVIKEKYFNDSDDYKNISAAVLTFSYAMNQTKLDKATIHSLSKNWKFKLSENFKEECVVENLNKALMRRGFSFKVNCVMNDSIATYMAGIMQNRNRSQIGLIIGTGMNAAFELLIKGQKKIINSEMAKTPISQSVLTEADKMAIEKLKKKNAPFQELEVLLAGYQFIEIVKNQIILNNVPFTIEKENFINIIDLNKIITVLRADNSILNGFDLELKFTALAFKRRTAKIMAPLLCAISEEFGEKNVSIIMNGSVAKHPLDQHFILYELENFSDEFRLNHSYNCVSAPFGSVDGSVFVSVVFLDSIQN